MREEIIVGELINSRLPNRVLLRWLDQLEYPGVFILTILTIFFAIWDTTPHVQVFIWVSVGAVIWLTIIYINSSSNKIPTGFIKLIHPRYGWLPSIILLTWTAFLYLDISIFLPLVNIISLVLLFAPPIVMFLRRRRVNSRFTSPLIVGFTLLVVIILVIGVLNSMRVSNQSLSNQLESAARNKSYLPITSIILWAAFCPLYFYYMTRRDQREVLRLYAIQNAMINLIAFRDPLNTA